MIVTDFPNFEPLCHLNLSNKSKISLNTRIDVIAKVLF